MVRVPSITEQTEETVLAIGVKEGQNPAWETAEALEELELLCKTAGGRVVDREICRIGRHNPATLIGSGKAGELAARVAEQGISTVVFDEDLSPGQGRNLEEIFHTKVIDRTQLILDIFAQHARSREGRLQIELAQLTYLLPRLRRMWTHLERQKGGMGMHGPGEKQLELDRRRILERIDRIKQDIEHVRGHRSEQRRGRRRQGWSLVSLVGYTNAGKSTLLNQLTGAEVLAYDKLFATLDPTTRQLRLPHHQQLLVTDTVGFIRKLPHDLVEAFKATLEEVVEADVLLHVIDVSHPAVDRQIEAVEAVLKELGALEKPVLHVLNKIDMPDTEPVQLRIAARLQPCISVSARTGQGVDVLRDALLDILHRETVQLALRVPMSDGRTLALLQAQADVLEQVYEGEQVVLTVRLSASLAAKVRGYEVASSGPAQDDSAHGRDDP